MTDSTPDQSLVWLRWERTGRPVPPWDAWEISGNVKWEVKPTERQLIQSYYGYQWKQQNSDDSFLLLDYRRIKDAPMPPLNLTREQLDSWTDEQRHEYFERWARGEIIEVQVDPKFVSLLSPDGWKEISSPSPVENNQ